MDARPRRALERFPCALDVLRARARQTRDDRPPYGRSNRLHRFEVAVRSDREAGLDHVHTESIELVRHAQLLVDVHAAAWRLLAIPQRGVEHRDPYSVHNPMSSLRLWSW